MRLLLCIAVPSILAAQAKPDPYMARALRVLQASPIVDGHNDLPWRIREDSVRPHDVDAYDLRGKAPGMTDLARLSKGHVGGQFLSLIHISEPTRLLSIS